MRALPRHTEMLELTSTGNKLASERNRIISLGF